MPHTPVQWGKGEPYSPQFDDVYRSYGLDGQGGIEQAEYTFLQTCELPQRWRAQEQFTILEAGFGLGLNFLYTWLRWLEDPQACKHLHFVSIEAYPVQAEDILRSIHCYREHPQYQGLLSLAQTLLSQYWGLTPGLHRLIFGQMHLSLAIGDIATILPSLQLQADAIFLDGFSPKCNPHMWSPDLMQWIGKRCAHGAIVASYSVAQSVRSGLAQAGFVCQRVVGLAPKRHKLKAVYTARSTMSAPAQSVQGKIGLKIGESTQCHCIVVGAGLAGAACAYVLAIRGWRVTVIDKNPHPAMGASAVPAALFAPKISADDTPTSRLLRAGQRLLLSQLQASLSADWPKPLRHGQDWCLSGIDTLNSKPRVLAKYQSMSQSQSGYSDWSRLVQDHLHHPRGGWVKPEVLVQSWLAHANIHFKANTFALDCTSLQTQCDLLLLANSTKATALLKLSPPLRPSKPLHHLPLLRPIRGQVSFGRVADLEQPLHLQRPINGTGHLLPAFPSATGDWLWKIGATFDRNQNSTEQSNTETSKQDDWTNLERLASLCPNAYPTLKTALEAEKTQSWAGIRGYSPDRLPLVGVLAESEEDKTPASGKIAVCLALGAHGLSLAPLCAALLAAQIHNEPWPIEAELAAKLKPSRFGFGFAPNNSL